MGTPHIGMGRDVSIFQIGESPYRYGVHSNLGTNIYAPCSQLVQCCFWFRSHKFFIHHPIHLKQIAADNSFRLFELSCFEYFYPTLPYKLAQIHIQPIIIYEFVKTEHTINFHILIRMLRIWPILIYEFVYSGDIQLVFNHELQSYFKWHMPSCGTNEYMVLYHYNSSGWWRCWYQFCCHGKIVNDTYSGQ